jgi:hypothetical protein
MISTGHGICISCGCVIDDDVLDVDVVSISGTNNVEVDVVDVVDVVDIVDVLVDSCIFI